MECAFSKHPEILKMRTAWCKEDCCNPWHPPKSVQAETNLYTAQELRLCRPWPQSCLQHHRVRAITSLPGIWHYPTQKGQPLGPLRGPPCLLASSLQMWGFTWGYYTLGFLNAIALLFKKIIIILINRLKKNIDPKTDKHINACLRTCSAEKMTQPWVLMPWKQCLFPISLLVTAMLLKKPVYVWGVFNSSQVLFI